MFDVSARAPTYEYCFKTDLKIDVSATIQWPLSVKISWCGNIAYNVYKCTTCKVRSLVSRPSPSFSSLTV